MLSKEEFQNRITQGAVLDGATGSWLRAHGMPRGCSTELWVLDHPQILTELQRGYARAGADIILLPAPGTVPGITMEYVRGLIALAHSLGCLTMTAIGTSQEGADVATIRQIALMCKMAGTDIHHIGDSGVNGMALPENIQAYSIAVRGVRHTIRRMARSVNR